MLRNSNIYPALNKLKQISDGRSHQQNSKKELAYEQINCIRFRAKQE